MAGGRGEGVEKAGPPTARSVWRPPQVQNIEFAQIEMKVVEGLQIGNQCLKKMHQVGPWRPGAEGAELRGTGEAGLVPEATPVPGPLAKRRLCWLGAWASQWLSGEGARVGGKTSSGC